MTTRPTEGTITSADRGDGAAWGAIRGLYDTRSYQVTWFDSKPLITIGRAGGGLEVDIALADEEVSRLHCVLQLGTEPSVLTVIDRSKNGTHINGACFRGVHAELRPGDVLRVGSTELVVVTEDGPQFGEHGERLVRAVLAYFGSMRQAALALGTSINRVKRLLDRTEAG
jgi:hypothetical protein